VQIWTCNGGANQHWRLNADGTIVGVESGLCLDVTGAATGNGPTAQTWTCTGGTTEMEPLTRTGHRCLGTLTGAAGTCRQRP
jgi:hypothetical protein